MFSLVAALALQEASVAAFDKLAQARDVAALDRYLVSHKSPVSPFRIIKTNGAYEVGKFGWHAIAMKSVAGNRRYVLFSTPLTSEDSGELLFERQGSKLAFIPEDDELGVRILHHDFDVTFMPDQKKVAIVDQVDFIRAGKPGPAFIARFSPAYRVHTITDASGKSVPFTQSSGIVSIATPPAASWQLKFSYDAIVDLPMYAASISSKEATLTNDYWYPMIARYPSSYDLTVHGPVAWTTVGQGEIGPSTVANGVKTSHFSMKLPVVYFSLSCGPYRSFFRSIDGRNFGMWTARAGVKNVSAQAGFYAPIIQFYERFAPFPFSQYGGLDSETYGGGAMEAYSYATYGGGLPSEDPHEPSHTWWGGIIPNTYLHSFWNESFADFSDGLYRREAPLGIPADRRVAFYQHPNVSPDYDTVPISRAGVDVGAAASTLGYGKGAFVLQMLEQYLGPDRMIQAMREWIRSHPKGTPGEWEQFEAVTKTLNPHLHLDSFFDDWLRRPGYARLSAKEPTFSNGALSIDLTFTGPAYRMPVDIMVEDGRGKRLFKMFDVTPKNGHAILSWPMASKPRLVSVDPYRKAVRDIHADEQPFGLAAAISRYSANVVRDPLKPEYATNLLGTSQFGSDLGGKILIGHPDTMPVLGQLLKQLGWTVSKNTVSDGVNSLNLSNGTAMAVVELPDGKTSVIVMGHATFAPNPGDARSGFFDDYGRFLNGKTEPKTKGYLTFQP